MAAEAHYIVVGGGTSGLVVANRLSEDPNTHVTVIEAGQDLAADPRVNIPALWTTLMGSEADWQFETVSQQGLAGRSLKEPQGKGLGGSSAINGQAFIAPSQAGIDAWAKLGNPGWDWCSLLPFYKKSYALLPPEDQATLEHLGIDWINEEHRGTDGPIKVSFPGMLENPLCKAWVDAFRALGKLTSADPFSGKSVGGYSNTATVDPSTKTRSYAGSTHGATILQRPNVTVLTGALAQKILFCLAQDGNITATGVEFTVDEQQKTLVATKEVILAAGCYNTPKLLELSGVGQKVVLEKHNIPLVLDLPGVGENLQDHLMTGVSFEVIDGVITGDALMRQEPDALAQAQELYVKHKAGPLTIGGVQSHAFMPVELDFKQLLDQTPVAKNDEGYINIVRSIFEQPDEGSTAWFMFLAQANLHENAKSFVGTKLLPENFLSLGLSQSHPFSRGNTHISSADAKDAPTIDPKYFSNPADLELMARHLQAIEKLRHTPEISAFLKPDGKRNHPDALEIADLEKAKKYILDTATTTYHPCGTAAMLPKDNGGVVDTKLKVYGTTNLRVVDASIFPLIPRGNIMSSVYAVAERAADIIKANQSLKDICC